MVCHGAWKANGDDGDGGCVLLMRRGFGGGELRRGGDPVVGRFSGQATRGRVVLSEFDPLAGQSAQQLANLLLRQVVSGGHNLFSWGYECPRCRTTSGSVFFRRGDPLMGRFSSKRPASGSFLYNSTYWWVNRQAGAPSPYRSGFCAKTGASIAGYMIRGGHAPLSYLHSPGTLTQWWAVFWKSDLPAGHPP